MHGLACVVDRIYHYNFDSSRCVVCSRSITYTVYCTDPIYTRKIAYPFFQNGKGKDNNEV